MITSRVKKILIVDDDPIILKSIQKQLADRDFVLEFISDPIEAISLIFKNDYDLVLSDVKMDPINGIEILRRIRKFRPGLPVIILTGYVDDNLRKEAELLGSSDFLIKPVRKEDLVDAISNVKIVY